MTRFDVVVFVTVIAAVSAYFAAAIAEQKQATGFGLLLGLLFGPFGIIAAGFVDRRAQCLRCGGRINSTPAKHYPICQHCGEALNYLTDDSVAAGVGRSLLRDE